MIKKLLYLNLLLFFFFPGLLHANLQFVDLENIDWQSGTGYNPFANTTVSYKVTFDVYNDSNSNEDCFVTISKGNNNSSIYNRISEGTFSNDTLTYQIYSEKKENTNNIIKEIPDLNSSLNSVTGTIKKNKSSPLSFFITVPKDQLVDSDTYSDSLDFKLYSGTYTNTQSEDSLMDSKTINLTIDVQSFLYLDSSVGEIVIFSNKNSTTGTNINFKFTVSDFNILAAGDYLDMIYVTLTEN